MRPEDLEQIRLVVREEIEASKPKIKLNPPRSREDFLAEWERLHPKRWWQR